MEETIGIYKIQSIIKPERIYIGSAVNFHNRMKQHLNRLKKGDHHSNIFQCHYNKYGIEDLEFKIIEYCSCESLLIREQFYINTLNPYFNISLIAGNPMLGRNHNELTIQGMRNRRHSKETKEKMRMIALKNQNKPPSNKNILHSDITKNKMRNNKNAKGAIRSAEFRENLRLLKLGINATDSAKQNMREAWKLRKLLLIKY